jgi:hypothetical protein
LLSILFYLHFLTHCRLIFIPTILWKLLSISLLITTIC